MWGRGQWLLEGQATWHPTPTGLGSENEKNTHQAWPPLAITPCHSMGRWAEPFSERTSSGIRQTELSIMSSKVPEEKNTAGLQHTRGAFYFEPVHCNGWQTMGSVIVSEGKRGI